jgi:hypothetical protein
MRLKLAEGAAMAHCGVARLVRHPIIAGVVALLISPFAATITFTAVNLAQELAASDDPAQIADVRLKRHFDRDIAEREIRLALSNGNVDLAESYVELSKDRDLSLDPNLLDIVRAARNDQSSVTGTARRFIHGFWTGETTDNAALAGTAVSDMFVFGDVRDSVRETAHYLTGQPYDPWILGMSAVGIGVTAATYSSAGAGLPGRAGLSLAKVARRGGRLNPALATRIVKVAENGAVVELVETAGRIEKRAGLQATLDALTVAEGPEDLARIERLAAAKGNKTRAILKLFGRRAFMTGVTALRVAKWVMLAAFAVASLLFWTLIALLGLLAWCKALASRIARFFSRQRATVT